GPTPLPSATSQTTSSALGRPGPNRDFTPFQYRPRRTRSRLSSSAASLEKADSTARRGPSNSDRRKKVPGRDLATLERIDAATESIARKLYREARTTATRQIRGLL